MMDAVNDAGEAGFSDYTPAPETAEQAIERLSKLSAVAYDQCREAEAKALNIRAGTLDAEVRKARGERDEPAQGRRMGFKTHEPHPDPVRLADVLDDLAGTIDRHLIVAPAARDAIALWITHTWVYTRFEHSPRLAITSPEKRCGKSTLLELLRCTAMSPVKADNLSASSVFRTVEALAPLTLLIDEADTHLKENAEELRGVLNSGFEASGNVIRVVEMNGEHVPVQFATYCPVALAAIGRLPETLEDRSVPVRLERKAADQRVVKFRDAGARDQMAEIGRKLARWAKDDAGKLRQSPAIPAALNDREGDISVPLLSIGEAAEGGWPERTRRALLALFKDRADDADAAGTGAMLLADIREIFTETGSSRMTSAELARRLGEIEDKPWAEWRQGKPITATQLSRALSPFRVKPHNQKNPATGEVRKGYTRDQFADAWSRYLPADVKAPRYKPLPATSPENNSEFSGNWAATDSLPMESGTATVADQEGARSDLVAEPNSATLPVKYSEVASSGWKRGDGENEHDELEL